MRHIKKKKPHLRTTSANQSLCFSHLFSKVPDSYHYRRRVHLYDTAARAQSETRSVDTSDLGVPEEDWFSEEAAATLLGYAEKEVMGHKVGQVFIYGAKTEVL